MVAGDQRMILAQGDSENCDNESVAAFWENIFLKWVFFRVIYDLELKNPSIEKMSMQYFFKCRLESTPLKT
jgi:hypothetical protein